MDLWRLPDCPNFPIPVEDPLANPIQFSLGNLSGAQTYIIDVAIGDCFFRFPFSVGIDPSTRRFNHHEIISTDKVLCHYDEICKNNEWLDQIVVPATLKAEEGKCEGLAGGLWGLFGDCGSYEFFCDNVKVHSKKVGTRTVRVGEWFEWMERTRQGIDISLYPNIGDLCSYMIVCENMPECRQGGGNIHGWGGEKEKVIDLGNGCFRIICKSIFFLIPAPDYTICGLDFLPDYIPFHYEPSPINDPDNPAPVPCQRMTKSFAEMLHFMPFLISEYGEVFTRSSLYTQLLRYKDDKRVNCADIIFCKCPDWANEERCKDNFKFLSSDINDVNCEVLDPAINDGNASVGATCVVFTNYSSDGKLDISYVWCKKKGDSVPRPRILNFVDYFRFWSSFRPGLPDVVNIIPDTIKSDVNFIRFGKIKIDSSDWMVDGIFSSAGKNFYHPFNLKEWEISRDRSADYIYQNLSNSSGIMIAKEGSDYVFLSKASESDSTKMLSLSSDNLLEILKVENISDVYYVYVVSDGKLMVNRSLEVCRSTPGDVVVLKIDIRTQSLQLDKIIQSDFYVGNTFYAHNGSVYCAVPAGKSISVGTLHYTSSHTSTLISIKSTLDGRIDLKENLKFTGNIYPVQISESPDGNVAYVFKGKGMIYDGNNNLIFSETNNEKIVILNNFDLSKPVAFEANNIDTSNLPIIIDNEHNLFVGINFTGNVNIVDSNFVSKGSKDIAVMKFNKFGQVVMSRQYGSPDEEILKELYFVHDVLFLGGEIAGQTTFRTIGALTFAKFVPEQRHAFISYDNFVENVAPLSGNTLKNRIKTTISDFTIIPNPAQSFIEVKLDAPVSRVHKLHITDLNGVTHYITLLNPNPINNDSFGIDVSHLPSGIFIIYITDPEGRSIPKKFIKLQH
ncbi:MAG: T9SS type A sorting domain-containing protein [Saprospiraceae bacterium]|nr:T9SS type A sorting domain-containing protein [Saprospiraceae bacterium]